MAVKIPFTFLSPKLLLQAGRHQAWLGTRMTVFAPTLKEELRQARVEIEPREYAAAAFLNGLVNGWVIAFIIAVIGFVAEINLVLPASLSGIAVFFVSLATVLTYPKIIAKRRARLLGKELIPAVRQLVIELRSGVALFQAMASVSNDYGTVSEEFRRVVRRIHAGVSDLDALAEASATSPSFEFRKVLWQVSNALKTGSDVATALDSLLDELAATRVNEIRRYGQELGPWAMIYMLTAVIMPSLGITMLIIILAFLDISIPPLSLVGMLAGITIFQVLFLNFVTTRRPTV